MSRQNTSVPRSCERAGQRACTVPTSNPPRLSAFMARQCLFYHDHTRMSTGGTLISIPYQGIGLLAPLLLKIHSRNAC
jgi:hypothetical protein